MFCKNIIASVEAFRNCVSQQCFMSKARGIGYSFQLAITAPSLFDHWLLYRLCAKLGLGQEMTSHIPLIFHWDPFNQKRNVFVRQEHFARCDRQVVEMLVVECDNLSFFGHRHSLLAVIKP